jgi:hypothetical protein
MKKLLTTTLSIALTLLLTLPAMAQDAPGNPDAKEDTEKKDTKKKKGKTFSDVITDEAESDEGLFTVHKVGSKYYFEIPDEVLRKRHPPGQPHFRLCQKLQLRRRRPKNRQNRSYSPAKARR